jgi:hypothetical protein
MNKRPGWLILISFVGIVFLVGVVAIYYIPHKPFNGIFFLSVLQAVKDLVIVSALVAIAGGIGHRFWSNIHPNKTASLFLEVAFGIGVLILVYLLAGVLGLYSIWFAWILLLVLIILFFKSVKDWLLGWSEFVTELRALSSFSKFLMILASSILFLRLLEALAPPTHFDALVYHLWLPSEFLEAGRFIFSPENPYWGMPLSSEVLYTWTMALNRPQTAAVLGWCIGVLTLMGIVGLGRNISPRAGWVAVAVLLAGETTSSSLAWAYADWGAAFLGLAVIVALDAWRQRRSLSTIILSGLMAGFAFGFKYTAGLLIPAGWIMIAVFGGRKELWKSLISFTLSASVIVVIWLGKNYVFTQSPLYPFLGSPEWVDTLKVQFYNGTVSPWPALRILLTPLSATIEGVEGAPGFSASIGPLLIGLPLGIFLLRDRKHTFIKGIGFFVVVGWVVWAGASVYNAFLGQTRLYFAIFPAWALLAAAGFEGFAKIRLSQIRFERLAGLFILISLLFSSIYNLQDILRKRPMNVIFAQESDGAYITRVLGAYYPAMEALQSLPPNSSVLNLWEPRGFYCRPTCVLDAWIDRWYLDRQRFEDEERILESWIEDGYSHVLLHRAGQKFIQDTDPRYTQEDWNVLGTLLKKLTLIENFGDGFELYRLVK